MSTGTIIITGASAGLGEEMARQFAALGYDLALCARRLDRLDELAEELRAATGRTVLTAALDVTDADAVVEVFEAFATELGAIDRIIVNAGVGHGAPIGSGMANANLSTARTNFVGALAQSEAAMAIFRRQGAGHLVLISSMAALRGMGKAGATYAATKAGVSSLGEGLRSERVKGVDVSVIHPGFILTDINAELKNVPFRVDVHTGVRSIVGAIEKRRATAYVPAWPWSVMAPAMKVLPLSVIRRFS